MAKLYFDRDVDASLISSKRVAVLGFGNQGRAHATLLRDFGVKVVVGARTGRGSALAESEGFFPMPLADASAEAEVLMMALPDEAMAAIYSAEIAPNVAPGKTLMVCHGFAFHFGFIAAPPGVDVCMAAPKGSGASLMAANAEGRALAGLVAVFQDATGHALETALGYACALGCGRAVIIETTFKEECVTDLFGEQAVLCGGIPELIKSAFRVLVDAGYSPESAYLECLHEAKLITDLLYERGLAGMRAAISDTAEWGGYQTGRRLVTDVVRNEMRAVLAEIESGSFARGWVSEAAGGKAEMLRLRAEEAEDPVEDVGRELRPKLGL
ncbi:MAG: ketol-acid reductoisomerase [Fimbriimonadaceae bacterium]